ncbi:MAG: PAS domain S-box protein [Acidobacteriota bacterium]
MNMDDPHPATSAVAVRPATLHGFGPSAVAPFASHIGDEWEGVFDSLSDAVTIHDEHFNIVRANAAARAMLGLGPAEAGAAIKCFRQYHGADAPPQACPSCRCLESRQPGVYELFEPHLNRHLEIRAFPRFDGAERCVGTIHVVRDISQRRDAETVVRDRDERFRSAFMTGLDACCVVRLDDGVIRECNAEFEKLFGFARDEVIGRTSLDLNIYIDSGVRDRAFADLNEVGHVRDLELKGRRKNGDVITCSVSENVVPIGQVPHVVSVVRDVTEQRRAEEERERLRGQLQQIQKMESVGRLAGGVAHDFNNMLAVILGRADLAIASVEPGSELHADLVDIRDAAQRSANLTRQLLAFARKQTVAPRVLDLNATVEGMLKMLRRLIGEDIDLSWRPAADLPPVMMDPGQIDQVLANLCVNARDAIDGVGRVVIETDQTAIDALYAESRPGLSPGEYVRLIVSDTGCGMTADTIQHVFEPFFTTKAVGAGTGLGLSTVYGIVKQNRGFIDVHSEAGHGTTFTMYLPRHAGQADHLAEADGSGAPNGRGETVLVVEDEPALLRLNVRNLESLGYRVVSATTPSEALRVAGGQAGTVDVLLTDVVMPEMDGMELARRLNAVFPRMKRIFTSGYTADVIVHRGVLDQHVHFIQKPSSRKALAATLRHALDQPS